MRGADLRASVRITFEESVTGCDKELELTLWDRSKRTAVLTPEGEFFYKEALKISRQYHRSLEAVYYFKDSKLQALHIGTLPFLSQYHLTSVIHSFCDTHPELSFSSEGGRRRRTSFRS